MNPETWPEGLLFCERVDILHRWGPKEVLCVLYVKLPIVDIRIETMLYIRCVDFLETEGSVGAVITGAGRIARVAESLGIPVPQPLDRGTVVKAAVDYVYVGVHPDPKNRHMRFLCSVEESLPYDWMVRQIWGALSS